MMWIPIKDKLPPPYEPVLLTVKGFGWHGEKIENYVTIGSYGGDVGVLAWAPLPEPYKEEK